MKAILLAILMLLSFALPAMADGTLPKRKPGLWEVKVMTARSPEGQTMKQCVDETTDERMMQMGGEMSQSCTKREIRQAGDGYVLESDCEIGGSRIQSKGTMKGDFSSQYETEVVASYDPPLMGMKGGTTKILSRRLGPCEAGQQPGDIILGNGMKMNINSLAEIGKQGAAGKLPLPAGMGKRTR